MNEINSLTTHLQSSSTTPSSSNSNNNNNHPSHIYALWFSDDNLNFSLSEFLSVCDYLSIEPDVVEWDNQYPDLANTLSAFQLARNLYRQGSQDPGTVHTPPAEWAAPFVLIRLQHPHEIRAICARSVGIKLAIEVWSHAPTFDQLHARAQSAHAQQTLIQPWRQRGSDLTWRVHCINYGWTIPDRERLAQIAALSYLDLPGKINLKRASLTIGLVAIYD